MKTRLIILAILMCLTSSVGAWDFTATSEEGLVFGCNRLPNGECSIVRLEDWLKSPCGIIIPESLFDGETTLTVTEIGWEAFSNERNLTDISLPRTIRVISQGAFENCVQLSAINIPEGVTTIGSGAFVGCSLKEVYIPASVTQLYQDAFACSTLEKVEFASLEHFFQFNFNYPEANPLYYAHHLYISGEEVTDLVIPESITHLRNFALCNGLGLKSLHIPATLKKTGHNVVDGCENLKDVYFETVESLCSINYAEDHNLLNYAERLYVGGKESNNLKLDEGVKSINNFALAGFKGLTSVKFGDDLTTIGAASFENCSNLVSLTLPQSIEKIGGYAFAGCKLRSIQILATVPPVVGSAAFSGQSTNQTTLYVPQGHFDDYAYDDTYWYRFINIKEFVGESAALSSNSVYSIKDNDAASFLVYDAVNDCLGSISVDTNIDNNALAHNWQVVKQGSSTMLYNLEAKRYLSQQTDGTWSLTSEAQAISLSDGGHGCIALDGKGEWMFVVNPSLAAPIPDGIEDVQADAQQDGPVYDLMGRVRNADSHNEILIMNGRKIVIR